MNADISIELLDAGISASPQPLSGEFSGPALDLIDP
jgi:hypothetical protein